MDNCMRNSYCIVRIYAPHLNLASEVMQRHLTLEQAQAHCRREDTHVEGEYFDGYDQEV